MNNVICRNDQPVFHREVEPLEIVNPLDQQVCVQVAGVLTRHYPGYDWLVEADCRKGFIDIRNISLDGQMGCRIRMNGPASASELDRLAVNYGGEILERFSMVRGRCDQLSLAEAATDHRGRLRFDQ